MSTARILLLQSSRVFNNCAKFVICCNMPTADSSVNPGHIIALLFAYEPLVGCRSILMDLLQSCVEWGLCSTTLKRIHVERLNICRNTCAYSFPRAVSWFKDVHLSVYDMNSYEVAMQSLYPPSWSCLPHLSANTMTGKR